MLRARLAIAVVGILLPYLARLPGGASWIHQYTDGGAFGFLFLSAFNAIAWGSMIALSFCFRRPVFLLFPCLAGFSFVVWAHDNLDLAADAQAAVELVFIPIFALIPIAVGGILGYLLDRYSPWHRPN